MDPYEAQAERVQRKKMTFLALFLMFMITYWPGGVIIENVTITILGWPFFVLWSVILGPAIVLLIFGYNAWKNIRLDQELQEEFDNNDSRQHQSNQTQPKESVK